MSKSKVLSPAETVVVLTAITMEIGHTQRSLGVTADLMKTPGISDETRRVCEENRKANTRRIETLKSAESKLAGWALSERRVSELISPLQRGAVPTVADLQSVEGWGR